MGLTILHLEIPRLVRQTSNFHLFRTKGKQNGKHPNNFFMVINGKNSKLKKDRPTHIWVQVNNTPIALDALHQSDDTMFGKKTQKENAQNHAIVVNGIEKEYAIGKAAMMDSWGSGEG
jgi:hypothetical protein